MYDVAIIGAGVVGSAIARELSKYHVNACVIERDEDVCCGTSKANSAIIHAGFDAAPGTLKAKLNVRGNKMMDQLSKDLDIPFKRNGSLVVCTKEQDPAGLEKLLEKGKANGVPDLKILNRDELQALLSELNLPAEVNWDWFIYLISKTGLRFAEALALTPADFDYENQQININKSWNYKFKDYGFQPTKNKSSNRKIFVDDSTLKAFKKLIKEKDPDQPIFVNQDQKIFNSTVNSRLATLCRHANIPTISIHGLRHTHASLLLFQGVSVLSVSRRLGHANITTTQETYLHIIKELETKDNRKILKHLKEL